MGYMQIILTVGIKKYLLGALSNLTFNLCPAVKAQHGLEKKNLSKYFKFC